MDSLKKKMEEKSLFDRQYEYYLELSKFVEKQMDKEEFGQAILKKRTYAFPTIREGILRFYIAGDLPNEG